MGSRLRVGSGDFRRTEGESVVGGREIEETAECDVSGEIRPVRAAALELLCDSFTAQRFTGVSSFSGVIDEKGCFE